ncbi:MAG: hypothetical protein DMF79_16490, partial [Acidobacteria bacterium]
MARLPSVSCFLLGETICHSSTPHPIPPHVGGGERCCSFGSAPLALVCVRWVGRLSWTPEKLPLIRLDRVSKDYTEGTKTRAVLREASATVAEGEFVAIRGRSGSGKSTLLNLLAGIDLPTAGDVWIGGACLNRLSPRARTLFRRDHLGFIFQFFNLIPTLTAQENVQLPAELPGGPRREAAGRARALLDQVGLLDRA